MQGFDGFGKKFKNALESVYPIIRIEMDENFNTISPKFNCKKDTCPSDRQVRNNGHFGIFPRIILSYNFLGRIL